MNNDASKILKIKNLPLNLRVWQIMAQFGKPIDDVTRGYLEEEGFGDGRTRAVGCMGWIWSQWLERAPAIRIRETVEPFVARGMEMQRSSSKFYLRPVHDLYLLHCAIFASSDSQLNDVAKGVIDASGFQNYTPHNDGELYASAWCGMLKVLDPRQARKSNRTVRRYLESLPRSVLPCCYKTTGATMAER